MYISRWLTTAYHMIALSMTIYPFLGEFFRPTYEYSLMPTLLSMAIIVDFRFLYFCLYSFFGLLCFSITYYVYYDRNLQLSLQMNVFDNITSFLFMSATTVVAYAVLRRERTEKEKMLSRFSLLGSQASGLIHDVRNMLSSPYMYIEEARVQLKHGQSEKALNTLLDLEYSLDHARKSLYRMNQMTSLTNMENRQIQVSEAVSEAQMILSRRLRGVNIVCHGDKILSVDFGYLTSLFLNLFMNSLNAMSSTKNKSIDINISEQQILFRDYGSGFSDEALKKISSGQYITTASTGTGIGLYIIQQAAQQMNADVIFRNHQSGAEVVLIFK